MIRLIFCVIIVLLFFTVVFWLNPKLSDSDCAYQEEFRTLAINGVVKRKFIDSLEHSYPIIKYEDATSDSLKKVNLVLEMSGIFDQIDENDHLIKNNHSDTLYITKENSEKKILVAKYDCR